MSREDFAAALGDIFEQSPWVASRAWSARPFNTVDDLHAAMTAAMMAGDEPEKLALLRAHPDLGSKARMTDASTAEQRGAGLDRLTPEEFRQLDALNADYKEKFAFPFLYAVKGSTKHDILKALGARLASTPDAELAEALRQVSRIARFRLDQVVEQP